MNIDVILDIILSRQHKIYVSGNPLLCPCSNIDPLPQTLCIAESTFSYLSFLPYNVCALNC
jgi:hypothetical protein